jgi:hypothetical protein
MKEQAEHKGVKGNRKIAKMEHKGKKEYRSPRLVVYGDLNKLTMAKGGVRGEPSKNSRL